MGLAGEELVAQPVGKSILLLGIVAFLAIVALQNFFKSERFQF
jgi:hypothetical protein